MGFRAFNQWVEQHLACLTVAHLCVRVCVSCNGLVAFPVDSCLPAAVGKAEFLFLCDYIIFSCVFDCPQVEHHPHNLATKSGSNRIRVFFYLS